ncbi:MAG: hypothetical protein V2I47_08690, partial [Bacteroidales bacterium]|nr:hypothetical protein [Bacteroidales bacterium]
MSEEVNYFICRNEECKAETNFSGDTLTGGKINAYEPGKTAKILHCEHCDSSYIMMDGEMYLFIDEIVIESYKDYTDFQQKYEAKKVKTNKLILRNFKIDDIKKKNISFHRCHINELIIENISITSTFYPLSFSECSLEKINVINTRIERAARSSYKSLYNYFGISLIRTHVKKHFSLEKCSLSLCIFASDTRCPIDISGKSKIEFSSLSNIKEPEIRLNRGSEIRYFNEVAGRTPSKRQKKAESKGELVKNVSIEELIINKDITEPSLYENCNIDKLVFESGSNVTGKLTFKNCIIGHVLNVPNSFEQDVQFLGTTFNHKILFSRTRYKQSLIIECCTFKEDVVLNDIKVEEDLHLSYSKLHGGLFISDNNVSGYVKCQVNDFLGEVDIQDNIIGRDILFRYIDCGGDFHAYHNEIKGYFFLRQVNVEGETELSLLNLEAITIDDLKAAKTFQSDDCNLKYDINMTGLEIKGELNFWMLKTKGSIRLSRSSIGEKFTLISTDSSFNLFTNNEIKGISVFSSCNYHKQTYLNRNIFHGEVTVQTMNMVNHSMADNLIRSGIDLDDLQAFNLYFDDNQVPASLRLKNSKLKDLRINNNEVINDLQLYNCKLDDIYINGNVVLDKYDFNYLQASDMYFSNNIGQLLSITNGNFSELNCTECFQLGDTNFSRINVDRGMKITDNHVLEEIFLHSCNVGQDLLVEYNTAKNTKLIKSDTGNIIFHRNFLSEIMNIDQNSAGNLDITESQVQGEFSFTDAEMKDIYIAKNTYNKSLEFKSVNAKNTEISYNSARNDLKIQFTRIQDLILKSCSCKTLEITNNSFSEVRISKCSQIYYCLIYNITVDRDIMIFENEHIGEFKMNICQTGKNIEIEKNAMLEISLLNTRAGDILFTQNSIAHFLYMNDNIANDIIVTNNIIAASLDEETIRKVREEKQQEAGLAIHSSIIEDSLIIDGNDSGKSILIKQNQSDKLSFNRNKTGECTFSMGSYRQITVSYLTEITELKCNNVTVSKDMNFTNNVFQDDFSMLYCKVENDLEFKGNIFNGRHRMYNNTILGTLNYVTGHYEDEKESFDIKTTFNMNLLMQHNRFNIVAMEDVQFRGTIYFEYNAVSGSFRIGEIDTYKEKTILFESAISMKENKIVHGFFNNLQFMHPVSLSHNVFNGDITFRNCQHDMVLDFTGCFVGGSFTFHNSDANLAQGDLVLDNAFIDKRISFTNYAPNTFSFINSTFNGFEIPRGWKMKGRKLIRELDGNTRKPVQQIEQSQDSRPGSAAGQEINKYAIKDDLMFSLGFRSTDIPYAFLKEIYENNDKLTEVARLWEMLQDEVFADDKILSGLDQTHQREDKATDGQILRYYFNLFNQCINDNFEPVYFR